MPTFTVNLVLLLLLGFGVGDAFAQLPTQRLSPEVGHYLFGENSLYLEDKGGSISDDVVLAGKLDNRFRPANQDALNFGVTSSTIWVKFRLHNTAPDQINRWLLSLDYPLFDYVTLYRFDNLKNWQAEKTGDMLPFHKRMIPHYNFVFALDLPDTTARTYYLKLATSGSMQIRPHLQTETNFLSSNLYSEIGHGLFFGALLIMLLYNLFLFLSLRNWSYLAYFFFVFVNVLIQAAFSGHVTQYLLGNHPYWANHVIPLLMSMAPATMSVFSISFLHTARFTPLIHKLLLAITAASLLNCGLSFLLPLRVSISAAGALVTVASVVVIWAGVRSLLLGNKSARFFLIAWVFLIVATLITSLRNFGLLPPNFFTVHSIRIATLLEVLLLAMALADRYNLYRKEKEVAQRDLIRVQEEANRDLEEKVIERTTQLNQSLNHLKTTQNQLIQAEKLASLGELTAGIAHEIQNPLNFVNNFSELSADLVTELEEEQAKPSRDTEFETALLSDLKKNLQRINQHGNRASGIVKSMLEHSRTSTGDYTSTQLNTLALEQLRLAYRGIQTKEKRFNCEIVTSLDPNANTVDGVSQDMGRVLLNLCNNAFYAVNEKKKQAGLAYTPTVWLATRALDDQIRIEVKDNGIGIPESIREKIFQPFFTTKPTGEGTGLGLSLSYDIITKGHKGTLYVDSRGQEGATFIITIPVTQS